jgi:hypothetical protein
VRPYAASSRDYAFEALVLVVFTLYIATIVALASVLI